MKTEWKAILILFFFLSCGKNNNSEYNTMTRVEAAYHENYDALKKELNVRGIGVENINLFLRAFKKEEILEVWAKNHTGNIFIKIKEYAFCATSGTLGPKRKEGDKQIPEGFYHIDRFNPKSKFYLSLGLNYPNASDLMLSDQKKPGSDIFIHGGCATVGCIPITDKKIKELYVLTSEAIKWGQKEIPVHIFPFKMTEEKVQKYGKKYPQHKSFWQQIRPAFLFFEKNKKLGSFPI